MSGRTGVVQGPGLVACGPEHGSGVGPAFREDWPLTSSLTLGALSTAPSCARLHARLVMCEWGMGDLAETAELVVSELLTNAVQASTEPICGQGRDGLPVVYLRLLSDRRRVLIEVRDTNPETPLAVRAEPDNERGRGLILVEALCERWGSDATPGREGKVVWAEMRAK